MGKLLLGLIINPVTTFSEFDAKRAIRFFFLMALIASVIHVLVNWIHAEEIEGNALVIILSPVFFNTALVLGSGLFIAGIMYAIVGGVRGEYVDALGIIGMAWLPFFFYAILRSLFHLLTGEPLTFTNDYVLALVDNLNPFTLWNVALQTIGFSVVFNSSISRVAIITVGYRFVLLMVGLGLAYRMVS